MAEAVVGGAERVELCAALVVGGLTPSAGLMALAAGCGVPCYPLIRPRAGDFVYDAAEVAVMRADIRAARAAGLPGVVLGAARAGRLDETVRGDLVAEAAVQLVCMVGTTRLTCQARSLEDLHAMLKARGDWVLLGNADEGKPVTPGSVEA